MRFRAHARAGDICCALHGRAVPPARPLQQKSAFDQPRIAGRSTQRLPKSLNRGVEPLASCWPAKVRLRCHRKAHSVPERSVAVSRTVHGGEQLSEPSWGDRKMAPSTCWQASEGVPPRCDTSVNSLACSSVFQITMHCNVHFPDLSATPVCRGDSYNGGPNARSPGVVPVEQLQRYGGVTAGAGTGIEVFLEQVPFVAPLRAGLPAATPRHTLSRRYRRSFCCPACSRHTASAFLLVWTVPSNCAVSSADTQIFFLSDLSLTTRASHLLTGGSQR